MNILKQIPNWFTLGNLTCGVFSILFTFQGDLKTGALMIVLAIVFDFFDGFLARLFKVSGELGKQLDSLADLVTFGVAPAFILYALSFEIAGVYRYAFVLLPLFSAYRLANFNIDKRQSIGFIGVPTPITGLVAASWVFIDSGIKTILFSSPLYYFLFCLILSYLLISKIKLPSLKLKKGPIQNYYQHLFLLIVGILSFVLFEWLSIPIFYLAYVLSSFLFNFATKKSK